MNRNRIRRFFAIVLCSFSFLGCYKLPLGEYEGRVFSSESQLDAVSIAVTEKAKDARLVQVSAGRTSPAFSVEASHIRRGQFDLEISFLPGAKFELKKTPGSHGFSGSCYLHKRNPLSPGDKRIEFCFGKTEFLFKLGDSEETPSLVLTGDTYSKQVQFELETPRVLSLDEAIAGGLESSFDTQKAFIRAYQASQQARAAFMNLAPHASIYVFWYINPSPFLVVPLILSACPFLVPSYWIDARVAALEAQIQDYAAVIAQANFILTLEQLTYALDRDVAVDRFSKELASELEQLGPGVNELFRRGEASSQSVRNWGRFTKELNNSIDDFKLVLEKDRYALALLLGFNNPKAIESLEIGLEGEKVEDVTVGVLEEDQLGKDAVRLSFERQQMDWAMGQSAWMRRRLAFNWLDPQGDSRSWVSPSLFWQRIVHAAKFEELEMKKKEAMASLYNHGVQTASELNDAKRRYDRDSQSLRKAQRLMERSFRNVKNRSLRSADLARIVSRAKGLMSKVALNQQTLFQFRVARAKKDRFRFTGHQKKVLEVLARKPFGRILPVVEGS